MYQIVGQMNIDRNKVTINLIFKINMSKRIEYFLHKYGMLAQYGPWIYLNCKSIHNCPRNHTPKVKRIEKLKIIMFKMDTLIFW